MYWLNKHARIRDQLSPYLDGALSPGETRTLEAHLVSCDACRAELDELRSTVAAVRELPQLDAPRSFALTPRMLEGRGVTPAPSVPPLALGMRLASAGVAVFLAVVVIGDLSDSGGVDRGGGSGGDAANMESADQSRQTMEFAAEPDGDREDAGAAAPAPEATGLGDEAPAGALSQACPSAAAAEGASGGTGAGGRAGTGGVGETGVATPTPQPNATLAPGPEVESSLICEEQAAGGFVILPTPSPGAPEQPIDTGLEAQPLTEDDGGVSTLRIVEIALAGVLVALLAGVVVELALRRRAA